MSCTSAFTCTFTWCLAAARPAAKSSDVLEAVMPAPNSDYELENENELVHDTPVDRVPMLRDVPASPTSS